MKKKALVLLLALSCSLSMIACSDSADESGTVPVKDAFAEESEEADEKEAESEIETEEESETPEETEAETESEKPAEKPSAQMPGELSDDLYDFQVSINGTVYQFPMWYSDFENMGWTYDGDNTQTLSSNEYSVAETWEKDGVSVYTDFANLSMNTATFSDCMVGGITLDEYYLEDCGWEIILPGGIQYGVSTTNDIIAAYGEPSSDYDGDLYYKMDYEYDFYQDISLYVYKETGTLDKIQIRNMIELEGADNSINPTVPDVVKNYEAPTSLGTDLYSFNVELEGNLYTLPCPVTEFVANGFEINEEESNMEIGAGSYGWVELTYNNQSFSALAYNFADYATIIDNCFVTSVTTSDYISEFELIVPGGIKRGDSEDALKTALADYDYEVDTYDGGYTYYTVYEPDGRSLNNYSFMVEDGVINRIEVSNSDNPAE